MPRVLLYKLKSRKTEMLHYLIDMPFPLRRVKRVTDIRIIRISIFFYKSPKIRASDFILIKAHDLRKKTKILINYLKIMILNGNLVLDCSL